jgi:H/ACA ribonucleoprotein complex subunit 3
MKHILKCNACGIYSLKEECKNCGGIAVIPKPPKYSPEDKYSKYRRIVKEPALVEKGLL